MPPVVGHIRKRARVLQERHRWGRLFFDALGNRAVHGNSAIVAQVRPGGGAMETQHR